MGEVKRYSLVTISNHNINTLNIYDDDKCKYSLSEIDFFTSNFLSSSDCLSYFGLSRNDKLIINYKVNGETKVLPCIFNGDKLIRYFASVASNGCVDSNDKIFNLVLSKFLVLVERLSCCNCFMNDSSINAYIKIKVREYLNCNYCPSFIICKLEQEIQKYKNLRDIILFLKKYSINFNYEVFDFNIPDIPIYVTSKNLSISRFIPSDLKEEPLFPPNSFEEDRYNAYLEQLPDEYSCHEKDEFSYSLTKFKK